MPGAAAPAATAAPRAVTSFRKRRRLGSREMDSGVAGVVPMRAPPQPMLKGRALTVSVIARAAPRDRSGVVHGVCDLYHSRGSSKGNVSRHPPERSPGTSPRAYCDAGAVVFFNNLLTPQPLG